MIQQYLALGDSYTIGEGVALFHSFPYQLMQALRQKGIELAAPEIIAKTGFTSGELLSQLSATQLLGTYQLVTVLIGVNNQYRGLAVDDFKGDFEKILNIAIMQAGNEPQRVYVLSIPDYSYSPFSEGHDKKKISAEISKYNEVKSGICTAKGVSFTDITTGQDNELSNPLLYVEDGLHPAPIEYSRWVQLLMQNVQF